MKNACAKLNAELIRSGYKSEIHREGFIVIESPKMEEGYRVAYVTFDKNRVLVSTMTEIEKILLDKYSAEDLAFAISQRMPTISKDRIRIDIKEGLLVASSLFSIGWFMTIRGLYKKVYDIMINCKVAVSLIIDALEFNKKFAFLRTPPPSRNG